MIFFFFNKNMLKFYGGNIERVLSKLYNILKCSEASYITPVQRRGAWALPIPFHAPLVHVAVNFDVAQPISQKSVALLVSMYSCLDHGQIPRIPIQICWENLVAVHTQYILQRHRISMNDSSQQHNKNSDNLAHKLPVQHCWAVQGEKEAVFHVWSDLLFWRRCGQLQQHCQFIVD